MAKRRKGIIEGVALANGGNVLGGRKTTYQPYASESVARAKAAKSMKRKKGGY